jgi:hypothetical protein
VPEIMIIFDFFLDAIIGKMLPIALVLPLNFRANNMQLKYWVSNKSIPFHFGGVFSFGRICLILRFPTISVFIILYIYIHNNINEGKTSAGKKEAG